jgi:transmembrane sensor
MRCCIAGAGSIRTTRRDRADAHPVLAGSLVSQDEGTNRLGAIGSKEPMQAAMHVVTAVNQKSATPSDSRTNAEAAAWFVRIDGEGLSATEAEQFAAWRSVPENAREYQRVAALWDEFDRIPIAARPSLAISAVAAVPSRELPRRRYSGAWGAAMAAVAACVVGLAAAPSLMLQWRADVVTRVGEIRIVPLPDGSTMTLDTDSAVTLDFNRGRRHVRLLAGEAAFNVASDPLRPFVVEAAGGTTRALGTEFIVRDDAGLATVIGIEHKVEVSYGTSRSAENAVTLAPGEQVGYGASIGLDRVGPAPVNADAWRRGQLIVENRPLAEVVAELDRYHHGRIRIIGDDVAQLAVNGVFPISDTRASVDSLRNSLGLSTVWLTDYLVIISR